MFMKYSLGVKYNTLVFLGWWLRNTGIMHWDHLQMFECHVQQKTEKYHVQYLCTDSEAFCKIINITQKQKRTKNGTLRYSSIN